MLFFLHPTAQTSPTNIISNRKSFVGIRGVQAGILEHQSLREWLHLGQRRDEADKEGGGTYNGVTELVVSGLVPRRALIRRPGVVEDEERSHRNRSRVLGVREEEAAAEGDAAIRCHRSVVPRDRIITITLTHCLSSLEALWTSLSWEAEIFSGPAAFSSLQQRAERRMRS